METATPPAPASKKSRFLINRNFGLLWSGQSLSNIGDFVFSTTLVLWIAAIIAKGQTWAPLAVSGVLLATSIPTLLIGPLAGIFVDRWDKRRTMLAMDAAHGPDRAAAPGGAQYASRRLAAWTSTTVALVLAVVGA